MLIMGDNIIKNSEIEETNSINSDEEDVKTCIDTNIKDILSNIQNLNKKKNKKVELKCCKKVKTCKKKAKDKKKKEECDEDVSDESVSVDSTSSSDGSDDTDKDSSIYDKDKKTDNSDSDSDSDSESCSDSCSESDSCDDDENDNFFEHSGVTNEGLGEMFHSVFVDNSGVTIAESLSSIATELHKLNNNIKKSYKNK